MPGWSPSRRSSYGSGCSPHRSTTGHKAPDTEDTSSPEVRTSASPGYVRRIEPTSAVLTGMSARFALR